MKKKHYILLTFVIVGTFILNGCAGSERYTRDRSSSAGRPSYDKSSHKIRGRHRLRGIASYYGKKFHGRKTANQEVFDMYAMTAAHKTLPFNTKVRVINRENGKSVIVRINDRGPYKWRRIIDLSYGAAQKINLIRSGTARVKLEILN